MKICPVCEDTRPSDLKFCPKDGTRLESIACPGCLYSVIGKRDKFCEKCGHSLVEYYQNLHVEFTRRKSALASTPAPETPVQ